jgi:hypothetical protein
VAAAHPEVLNLIPDDVEALVQELDRLGATVDYDKWGVPSAIGARRAA